MTLTFEATKNHSLAPKTSLEIRMFKRHRRVTRPRCQRPTSFGMHRAMTVGVFYWKRWLSVGIINGWPPRDALRSFSDTSSWHFASEALFKLFESSLYMYKEDQNTIIHCRFYLCIRIFIFKKIHIAIWKINNIFTY